MATNSLNGVNSTRISQLTLEALQTTVLPFSAFSTNFSADVATRGSAVTTRYVTNPSVQDFSSASRASTNSATTARTITLSNYVGVDVGFSDTEMSFSDVQLMNMYIRPAIVALFENVMASALALVTNANFSANTVITAANFTAANIAGLAQSMNESKVGRDRHIILPPSYAVTAKKDTSIQAAYAYGSPEAIRTGRLPDVYGFQMHEWNGTIPTNSENLAAVALAPEGILLAARAPALPRNWNGEVQNVTDPDSGLTIQIRDFYDDVEQRTQFCLIYGTQVGNPANVRRILSA